MRAIGQLVAEHHNLVVGTGNDDDVDRCILINVGQHQGRARGIAAPCQIHHFLRGEANRSGLPPVITDQRNAAAIDLAGNEIGVAITVNVLSTNRVDAAPPRQWFRPSRKVLQLDCRSGWRWKLRQKLLTATSGIPSPL